MDQYTLGLDPLPKKTRKEVFLDEMNQVVPWATLVTLIAPFARGAHQALGGRPPFPIETMLRITRNKEKNDPIYRAVSGFCAV